MKPVTGWGFATCRTDGEPLVSTFEFPGAEFYCVSCQRKYGFLEPVPATETPEIVARHKELRAQYLAERAERQGAVS